MIQAPGTSVERMQSRRDLFTLGRRPEEAVIDAVMDRTTMYSIQYYHFVGRLFPSL